MEQLIFLTPTLLQCHQYPEARVHLCQDRHYQSLRYQDHQDQLQKKQRQRQIWNQSNTDLLRSFFTYILTL